MRALGFIAATACVAALACNPAGRTGTGGAGGMGAAPKHAPIRLLGRDAQVVGGAREETSDTLIALDADSLSRDWTTTSASGSLRFASGILDPEGLPGAGVLRIRLRPGGATGVSIIPHPVGDQLAREHRALRRLEIALEPGRSPDAPLDLSIDLYEALHGSFGDAGRDGRLHRLEVLLTGADPEHAALLALAVEARQLLPPDVAAAAIVADHYGVLRPAWALTAGATVTIPVSVPAASELRWTDAASAQTGSRVIEIEDSGATTVLFRSTPSDAPTGAAWVPQRRSLARWAGHEVTLRMRVEGAGIGLFGEPVIARVPDASTPDVLVYLIDTLRADHLGAFGSPVPNVSPNLDRLAREGVWFRRAQSSSSWTKPAIATLMTGVQPPTHRVGATSYTDELPASVPLVQERFRDAGWRTGSFTASPLGSTLSALERGFEIAVPPRFWRGSPELGQNPSANQLGGSLVDWVREQPDRPFFAYLHTLEVHEWKLPRYQRDLPAGYSAYDAAIRDADRQLGALLDALVSVSNRTRPLWVVVVSDHGESWGDHGMQSHGFGLYQSQTHIPLIFWSSEGTSARSIETPVGLADLAPTLLDGFGLTGLSDADGTSLVPALRGGDLPARPILTSLLRFVWAPDAPRQYAIITPDHRSLIRPEHGIARVFDLVIDPQELRPARATSELERTLDQILAAQSERAAAFEALHGPVVPGAVTLDGAERLRALGYLEDSAPLE